MTYEELQQEVILGIKDKSGEVLVRVPEFVNAAIALIAEDVDLPALKTLGIVTTVLATAYTVMPSGDNGRLVWAGTAEGALTIFKEGLVGLLEHYTTLDNEGDVEALALEGSVVYYQNIPSDETDITVLYFKSPTELVNSVDVPTCIPLVLHRDTIVPRACAMAYSIIEAKMEGSKPNMDRCMSEYEIGKSKLLGWISKRRGQRPPTVWDV